MAPRTFTAEFRSECVREVVEKSRTVASVAREFNVGPETLRNWVKAYRRDNPEAVAVLSEGERTELERLRKEIRELRQEREFLGKAAAFFAKGSL